MRRSLAAVVGTAAGLIALLNYKSGPAPHPSALAPPPTTRVPIPLPPPTTARTRRGSVVSTTSTTFALVERTVDGPVVQNKFGPVQVEVTVKGGALLDVGAVQLPTAHQRSAQISNIAAPVLRREALASSGTRVDAVSGATYTSEGYARSLQAALDLARR